MRLLITTTLLLVSQLAFGQSQHYDPRVLRHFTPDELDQMSPDKRTSVTYYYCQSYTLDASPVPGFLPEDFDVAVYEELRRESVDFTFVNEQGLVITLVARSKFLPNAQLKQQ